MSHPTATGRGGGNSPQHQPRQAQLARPKSAAAIGEQESGSIFTLRRRASRVGRSDPSLLGCCNIEGRDPGDDDLHRGGSGVFYPSTGASGGGGNATAITTLALPFGSLSMSEASARRSGSTPAAGGTVHGASTVSPRAWASSEARMFPSSGAAGAGIAEFAPFGRGTSVGTTSASQSPAQHDPNAPATPQHQSQAAYGSPNSGLPPPAPSTTNGGNGTSPNLRSSPPTRSGSASFLSRASEWVKNTAGVVMPPRDSNIRKVVNILCGNPLQCVQKLKEAFLEDEFKLKHVSIQKTSLHTASWSFDSTIIREVKLPWGPFDPATGENAYEVVHTPTVAKFLLRQVWNGYCVFTDHCLPDPVIEGEAESWRELLSLSSQHKDVLAAQLKRGWAELQSRKVELFFTVCVAFFCCLCLLLALSLLLCMEKSLSLRRLMKTTPPVQRRQKIR
ncbi:unnamed protein product [Amoebophrya sp. A25]|nr:unnamed protein product [Amoebophrya sp. A25]|eukprot:GSA25T00017069001.1